ncbi:MAG: pyrophosphohydrolase [Proteobacteria bacterium SG_bin7]|nr:MAG: pyrophosphohydrolase [Proteobacteria bacterium SG_bin7]
MKAKRPNWIPVVTGLIMKGDQVLVGLRPEGKNLAGQWEFPGGKIEANETPEGALQRELKEELGIEAEVGAIVFAGTHSYGETGILLLFYIVKYWKGEPKPFYHRELKWVHLKDLQDLDIPGANRKVLPHIVQLLP